MTSPRIEILEGSVRITDLEVHKPDVAAYLRSVPEAEVETAIVRAIEVGVFCLERAQGGQDLDFVRRQIDTLLAKVQTAIEGLPEETRKELLGRIGTAEGQVLAPIQSLVNEVSRAATDKIKEVKALLDQEIDPSRESSTLGRSLRTVKDLLDPKRTDSIQGSVNAAIKTVTDEGGSLAKSVREVVATAVRPLTEQVDALTREIRGADAAAEALAQTIEKGSTYEEAVVVRLRSWSEAVGAEITHVGPDSRPGDVLVVLTETSVPASALRIIVEARDRERGLGRKPISDLLAKAMTEREARAAVYVSQSRDGLAKEIGEWAEGACDSGPFVACTNEHLVTAVRFLIAMDQLSQARAKTAAIDVSAVGAQLGRIRTALRRIMVINTKVTDVKSGADAITVEATALRTEIQSCLNQVEEALRLSSAGEGQPTTAQTAG